MGHRARRSARNKYFFLGKEALVEDVQMVDVPTESIDRHKMAGLLSRAYAS
jgi:hypothetical protein